MPSPTGIAEAPRAAAPPLLLHAFLRRGAFTAVACSGLAGVLWLFGRSSSLAITWLYCIVIGACCWLLTDGSLQLVARGLRHRRASRALRHGWPGWRWAALLVPIGSVAGYVAGSALVDALTGRRSPNLLLDAPQGAIGALLTSLLTGAAITGFFYSRERLAAVRAQAEAAERLAAETRLALLQSQLEPHMLFNTLANLRVLIGLDPPRAQAMLDRLIGFLRATLAASRGGEHALAAEFDRLADYLALIGVRMGPRLQSVLELPPALRTLPVPSLLLQPLVENSVQHGLEPKVEGGRIEVRAARDGDRLRLSVRDTGLGLREAAPTAGTKFGLQQVRQRLQTLYGDTATLTLAPAGDAEGGTLACITLPLAPASTR